MAALRRFMPVMAFMYPIIDTVAAGSLADIEHVVLFMQGKSIPGLSASPVSIR